MSKKISYFVLFVFLGPIFMGGISDIDASLKVDPVIRALGGVFCAAYLIVSSNFSRNKQYNLVIFKLFLFTIFGLVSLLWTISYSVSINRILLNSLTLFIVFIIYNKLPDEIIDEIIIRSCWVSLFIVVCVSVPAIISGDPSFYHQDNFKGYFSNSNSLAHYISLAALPIITYEIILSLSIKRKILLSLVVCVVLYVLMETRSRGAFISFVGGGILFLYFVRPYLSSIEKITISFLLIFFVLYFTLYVGAEKYEGLSGIDTRSEIWGLHWKAILENLYLGYGVGVNPVDFKIYTDVGYDYMSDTEKGNSYYILIEEIGLFFGGCILLIFFVFIFIVVRFFFVNRNNVINLNAALFFWVMLSGLIHGVFESWIFSFGNPMAIIFWLSCVRLIDCASDSIFLNK